MQLCSCAGHRLRFYRLAKLTACSHVLQGELEITTEAGTGKAKEPGPHGQVKDDVSVVPFLMLGLDLPPPPLYKDIMEQNIIPQVWPCRAFPLLSDWLAILHNTSLCACQPLLN